jgi:aminoglycoside phosphotransferase
MKTLLLELTDPEFYILAQYLKRLSWLDYTSCAIDENEAHSMKDALNKLEKQINDHGFKPR